MDLVKGEIKFCISKIVNIFILHCSHLSSEHPILCATSLFLLLVYLFLPSLFYFLLHSFPILVLILILIVASKFALHHTHCNKNIIKQEEQINTQTKSFNRAHSVRRRKEQQQQQNKVEEKDMVSSSRASTLSNNDILVDKAALIEDNPKDIREVKVDDNANNNNRIEGSSVVVSKRVVKSKNGKKGSFGGGYHDGRSSDDDQEDDENKALEWTEDDQKNLTDLGLSEIERNKRLESLIAKRMARKLLSIQVRKTLMNMGNSKHHHGHGHGHGHGSPHLASILIPKASSSSDSQISPKPCSAPSVLLPNRNPFDLPYDSHEEKPNLTGHGLPEEAVTSQPPKDLMFCRHVSFSQGVHFPCPEEFDNDRPAPFNSIDKQNRIRSIPEFPRLRKEPRANKNEKKGNGDRGLSYTNKSVIHHASRYSIDSDMQVEMTETASHLDLASLGLELEDESDDGKPWAASSHLAGVEENESRSREVHEVSEKDVIAVGFARLNPICDDHVLSNEIEPPVLYPNDGDGSHSTHSNVLEEKPGEQEQEKSSSTTTKKNIMNDVPENNNNDKDILDFIKQTYGEEGSNGQRSSPSDENHIIASANDENRTNAAPIDENNNCVSSNYQNCPNPFVGLSSLIVNTQQPILDSKEQHETMIEGGPSDLSSSSTPKSSSTIKGENREFDVNEVNSETVASSTDGGDEQFGVERVSLNMEPIPFAGPLDSDDDEAGPSNEVQETDTGPPFGSSSPSPKSVLQKKFSMASISSSDQINMEIPQPEQPNEDVISVSPTSQHNIQSIHDPSTHIVETISKSAEDPESIIIGLTQSGSTNEIEVGSHNADDKTVKSERGKEEEGDNKTADKERNLEGPESVQVNKDKSKEKPEEE